MAQDKQPRRASKDVSRDKLHPRSDMNARAAGDDKESHEAPQRQLKGSGQAKTSPGRKPGR
jgi:hypothetical protein